MLGRGLYGPDADENRIDGFESIIDEVKTPCILNSLQCQCTGAVFLQNLKRRPWENTNRIGYEGSFS